MTSDPPSDDPRRSRSRFEDDHVTADDVIDQARRETGLADDDDRSYREGLERVVEETGRDEVSSRGKVALFGQYTDVLSNRLRVAEYLRQHPDVLHQPVEHPLVVLGMPRTGTSKLSWLLGQDGARRSLLNWEATDSVPPPTTETLTTDPRCVAKRRSQEALAKALPALAAAHWGWADQPVECAAVLRQDFKAGWASMLPSPDFARWLWFDADLRPSYRYEKRVLQLLQSLAPGTWSLKMPTHALFVDALLDTFPDARLVWTHRDPLVVAASLCDTIATVRQMFTDGPPDLELVRQQALLQLGEIARRMTEARESLGPDRVFNLHYARVQRQPIEELRRLYEWAGDEFTVDVEHRMRRWLDDHPQGGLGAREYAPSTYRLTRADIDAVVGDYEQANGIELETHD